MGKLYDNETDVRNLPTLSCAFVGDSVYDLLVREYLVRCDGRRVGELNREKVSLVCAASQAAASEKIIPLLSEDELAAFKRGRNVTVHSVPKNSTLKDYHAATGLEALFGYLYLSGKNDRIQELFSHIICENDE